MRLLHRLPRPPTPTTTATNFIQGMADLPRSGPTERASDKKRAFLLAHRTTLNGDHLSRRWPSTPLKTKKRSEKVCLFVYKYQYRSSEESNTVIFVRSTAIASELRNQRATLGLQKEEYVRKANVIKRELESLKEQRTELRGDTRRSPSPETQKFLKENAKLQVSRNATRLRRRVSLLFLSSRRFSSLKIL